MEDQKKLEMLEKITDGCEKELALEILKDRQILFVRCFDNGRSYWLVQMWILKRTYQMICWVGSMNYNSDIVYDR